MTKIALAFTICTATERGKFAVKQITLGATVDYDRVKWWQFEPVVETSLEVMADRLRTLALQPKRMIVMGAPLAGLDLNGWHPTALGQRGDSDAHRPRSGVAAA